MFTCARTGLHFSHGSMLSKPHMVCVCLCILLCAQVHGCMDAHVHGCVCVDVHGCMLMDAREDVV